MGNKLLKNNIEINSKESFRDFCNKNLDKIRKIPVKDFGKNKDLETFLIEFRSFPHTEFLIRNAIYKLSSDWNHTIVCGNLNYELMIKIRDSISPNIKIIKLDIDNINRKQYSSLLCTIDFWKKFEGEKLLIYQEDSCIFKSNIEDFLEVDYIGSPWKKYYIDYYNINPNLCGNGGISLRSKSVMIKCLELSKGYHPEDIFFSNFVYNLKDVKLADYDSANKFGQESVYSEDPFCGHQFWSSNIKNKKLINLEDSKYFEYLNK